MNTLSISPRVALLTLQPTSGPALVLQAVSHPQIVLAAVGVQGPPGPAGSVGSTEWPDLPSPDLIFSNLLL